MAPSAKQQSQKEYLKKYLSKKKKKKPRRNNRRGNVKLIDDDCLNRNDDNPFDDFEDAEDAPVIAGYYDERPTEVKLLENYRNANRWQPMPGADKDNDGGNQKSRLARDGHSPTATRRERYDEDSRSRKRKNRSAHGSSPRSKRQELSPARRTPPRAERRMEERGYSPSRRGDKFEEQRSYSDAGQRFRDTEHSPRRTNSGGRYNGDGDRFRPDEQIDDRYSRPRQRQRSVDSGSPDYRNQRGDDEFRGSAVRRGDQRASPFGDRFERPQSPRRKERPDERRYPDEGRREAAASRSQRNRHYADAESPPQSKQQSSRGDERLSARGGVSHRHNGSPSRNNRRGSPDRRLSPARNERRASPARNDRRGSPSRNDRRQSPLRNDRRLSPSPRDLDDSSWRRSFSPAPSRRLHSPQPVSDSRRADRRVDRSPVRTTHSRNERPPSPTFRDREGGRRVDDSPIQSSHRRKDRSREDKQPRDRSREDKNPRDRSREDKRPRDRSREDKLPRDRRRDLKELLDIRDVSIDPLIVQEARSSRDSRHARETFRDAGDRRRDRLEAKEPPVRIIEWKEKSTAVSRSVPAKRVPDSPPPRAESPRRREESPPRKHKDKAAGSTKKVSTEEQHRSAAKHRVSKHESQPEPASSPKHRGSRREPSTPPSRHRDESKQRTQKHDPEPRPRRTSPEPHKATAKEKRSAEDPSTKAAKKRDPEDRDHKKSEKSSRSKDEKFGLLSTKKSSSKPEDKLTDEQAGKNATTIYRDAKTGKKRDLREEKLEKIEKRRQEDQKMEQYYKWGRGLKQVAEEDAKMQEEQYEMSKPLARYADDDDLDKTLKQKEISGLDPMLEYIHKKKRKKEAKEGKVTRPQYKGSWPPNRFNIPPGHKWDGVDRSNGYENRYFAKQSDKKAMEEEAYKWCSEDM